MMVLHDMPVDQLSWHQSMLIHESTRPESKGGTVSSTFIATGSFHVKDNGEVELPGGVVVGVSCDVMHWFYPDDQESRLNDLNLGRSPVRLEIETQPTAASGSTQAATLDY